MVKFAKKVQEKEIAYNPASRKGKFDATQNRKERNEERKAEGKEKNRKAIKEHYKKINKKIGGTLTPKKKKTPKNVPKAKKKIRKKMKELEKDVDKGNEIRRRKLAGERIRAGDSMTAAEFAIKRYNNELMRNIKKTIRKP